jgi:hypothetical protein
MADMERADDFVVVTEEIDHNAGDTRLFAIPRACRLVKAYGCKAGAFTGASTVTFSSSYGALADTLVIPTGGAAGDIVELDVREEADNQFAEGSIFQFVLDGTPSAASLAAMTFVFRPL